MHRGRWMTLAATAGFAVLFSSCSDRPTAIRTGDQELALLTQRAVTLHDAVARQGSITAAQRAELDEIVAAIREWQARTGRDDIAVSGGERFTAAGETQRGAVAAMDNGGGVSECTCPATPSNAPFGYYCFLDGTTCNPDGSRVCSYKCIRILPIIFR